VPGRYLFRGASRGKAVRHMRNPVVVSPRLVSELMRSPSDYFLAIEYTLATVWCIVAARLARRRVLLFQENRRPSPVGLPWGRRVYRRFLARMADGLIANTRAAEDEILTDLNIDFRRVTQITLLSPPSVEALTAGTTKVEPPSVRPLFLFVGRLIALKNVETLLQAAGLLMNRGLDFSVWIVGDGPLRQRLNTITRALRLEGAVTFLGPVPYSSIGHLYAACDVFVLPSHVDYRSIAVLEAMRFGKPILASKFDGNVGDAVRSGYNGYSFDPGRPDELADQMAILITDRDLRQRMGNRSKEMIEEQTPMVAAMQLSRLLRQWPLRPDQWTRP
jgi:glycosyltransferase involved in cell wall biosynthesis